MLLKTPTQTALITGTTSGIGAAFAKNLASQGYNLIITGRREEIIKALSQEIQSKHNVSVEVMIIDLTNDNDLERLIQKIKDQKDLNMLVNNAGFGSRDVFYEGDITFWENMIKTHATAVTKLTYAALQNMLANKSVNIINVSSILALFPYRLHVMYNATKAFINMFSRSLSRELRGTGVRIQALCPGLTVTDFHTQIGLDTNKAYKARGFIRPMKPETVVARSLQALEKNRVVYIPGIFNKLLVMLAVLFRFKG